MSVVNMRACLALPQGQRPQEDVESLAAGAYTRPLFSST